MDGLAAVADGNGYARGAEHRRHEGAMDLDRREGGGEDAEGMLHSIQGTLCKSKGQVKGSVFY